MWDKIRDCLGIKTGGGLDREDLKSFFSSPIFWGVLVLKMALGSLLASYYMRDLFVPFLNCYVESGFANPWGYFARIGMMNVFPYPPVMLYFLTPFRWLFSPLLADGIFTVTPLHLFVMRLPLLFCDILMAVILLHWFPRRVKDILILYWCSPFVIYICYWHGQLDMIPTALFLCCLYLLRSEKYFLSMVFCGLALSAKSHLLVALPFLAVYIFQKKKLLYTLRMMAVTLATYFIIVFPFLSDPAFGAIVYGTGEQSRFFSFQVPIGYENLAFLMAPGAVVVLWYRFTAYSRRNWDLFMLYLGILFCVFIIFSPPAPGYFLWPLPFIIHFLCRDRRISSLPYFAFAFFYLAFFWLGSNSDIFTAWKVVSPGIASIPSPYNLLAGYNPAGAQIFQNLLFTVMQISLLGLVLNMYIFGVKSNAVYRMRTTPFIIGLAGDSGSGKDTMTGLLSRIMGKEKVTAIAGDDYHRWERGHRMWKVYTHLDVRGNDLYRQQDDAIALSQGKYVIKGEYDHKTGRFTEQQALDPGQVVIFQGLHALTLEGMRNLYDLRIFMEPEEELRCFWKICRDSKERGYSREQVLKSIEERKSDTEKFIVPQQEHAEIIVKFGSCRPLDLNGEKEQPDLCLEVRLLNSFNLRDMVEKLDGFNGLEIFYEPYLDTRYQMVKFRGKVSGDELLKMSNVLVPDMEELTSCPVFDDDLNGCLQLLFVVCMSQKIRFFSEKTLPF